jgi:hypothetical protein
MLKISLVVLLFVLTAVTIFIGRKIARQRENDALSRSATQPGSSDSPMARESIVPEKLTVTVTFNSRVSPRRMRASGANKP